MNLKTLINHGEHGGHSEEIEILAGDRTTPHMLVFFAVFAVPAVVTRRFKG